MTESTVTVVAKLEAKMTVPEQSTVTMAENSSNSQAQVKELSLHPGYTTLISFSAAIILVLAYLYFENVVACTRKLCQRRNSVKHGRDFRNAKLPLGGEGQRDDNGGPVPADTPETAATISGPKVDVEEPGVLCDCGQIHLLRDCINEDDLHAYKDILQQIDTKSPKHSLTLSRFSSVDETLRPGPMRSYQSPAKISITLSSPPQQSGPGLTIPNLVYASPNKRESPTSDAIA